MPDNDDEEKIIEIERELDKLRVHPTITIGEREGFPADRDEWTPQPDAESDEADGRESEPCDSQG